MANIALIDEGFRKRTTFSDDPAGYTSWTGPDPRLNVADGSVAYGSVEAVASDLYGAAVVGYLPAFTLAKDSIVYAQVRFPDGLAGTIFIGYSRGNEPDAIGTNRGDSLVVPAGGEWHLLSVEINLLGTLYDTYAASAAAGDSFVFASHAPRAYDVSFLGFAQGSIPTRVYPRADGLGMGAPRIMDNRSPYRSARVFGMI